MIRFILGSLTGWVAVLATGIEIALPTLLRSRQQGIAEQTSADVRVPNLRARMWPHYWLGYMLAALVIIHTSLVGPAMGRSDVTGIWAATLALCLLFLQIGLGLALKSRTNGGIGAPQLRRWHFWSMIGFVALVATHLVRNG